MIYLLFLLASCSTDLMCLAKTTTVWGAQLIKACALTCYLSIRKTNQRFKIAAANIKPVSPKLVKLALDS